MEHKYSFKSIVQIFLLSCFFLFIILYARNRTAFLSQGVSLSVENIEEGQTIRTNTYTIKGVAKRAVLLTINNRELLIDQEGNFEDLLVLSPGINIFTIEAWDRFDNYKKLTYTIWHETETTPENTLTKYKENHASSIAESQKEEAPSEEIQEELDIIN